MLVEDVVARHEFDWANDDAGRAIGKRVKPRCDSVSEAKRGDREVIQAKQGIASTWRDESWFVREPVGEVDVKPMTIDSTAGGNSKHEIVARGVYLGLGCRRRASSRWRTLSRRFEVLIVGIGSTARRLSFDGVIRADFFDLMTDYVHEILFARTFDNDL